MGQELRQSSAITLLIGPFIDETDGKTAETGLTIAQADVRLSKNAGNMAQKNEGTSCTHDELGYYGCPVDTTDTNTLGRLKLMVHESGALPVWHEYMVITQQVWDSKYSTDKLQVDAVEVSGDSAAADNLELACDNYSVTRGLTGTAVPAAAANAAGGLPISAAGAVPMDEITAARLSELDAGTAGKMANQVDEIRTDTGEIGTAGAGLSDLGGMSTGMKAEVESEVDDAVGGGTGTALTAIPWNSSWDTEVQSECADALTAYDPSTKAEMDTAHALLATPAQVNTQALDVLNGDTYGEPGQEAPGATLSIAAKINYIFKWARNKLTQSATELKLYADDGSTVDQKATVSDDGTTYTRGEIGSGP